MRIGQIMVLVADTRWTAPCIHPLCSMVRNAHFISLFNLSIGLLQPPYYDMCALSDRLEFGRSHSQLCLKYFTSGCFLDIFFSIIKEQRVINRLTGSSETTSTHSGQANPGNLFFACAFRSFSKSS
jgi:hypothetical protein